MALKKGTVVLMGSGELTTSMVEVHKELLAGLGEPPRAVFLDTPAGFQLNVDQISQKALDYFSNRIQQPMSVASFKSRGISPYEAEQAFHTLRNANFVMIGPGSPSFAVRQWKQTPIPEILINRVEEGGCLVTASAAALTIGRFTLPVYEIYKVGEELHWVEGMNILEHFGFRMVVVPHWNNAEGGTHDTRFCYMGEPRFRQLESLLPEDLSIFGLDEHTACIMDLEKQEGVIKGIGRATLRRKGAEQVLEKGKRFSLDVLRGAEVERNEWRQGTTVPEPAEPLSNTGAGSFWDSIHTIEGDFLKGLENREPEGTANALLALDRIIWKAKQDLENEEFISQARDIMREMIVSLCIRLETSSLDRTQCLAPLVEKMLKMRENFRKAKRYKDADAIRECLQCADITIEDLKESSRWVLKDSGSDPESKEQVSETE